MKATAVAPSNIAFIKYWGKKNNALRLPENGSISMNLSNLTTTTTVEFNPKFTKDTIIIDGIKKQEEGSRVIEHIDRIRSIAQIKTYAKVVSKNNFPSSTGLSSSASGFAALTLAAAAAAGLTLSKKELSILARLGSGSACRSIPDGFVEWIAGNTSEQSYAKSLYSPDYWDIVDIVVLVSNKKKDISTTNGQQRSKTSPFFPIRKIHMATKIKRMKQYIAKKDFQKFGDLIEAEALELHAIMITSFPSLLYVTPESLIVMKLVKKWQSEGLPVFFTLNTGQNVHILCQKKDVKKLLALLQHVTQVTKIIVNTPSPGARIISSDLF